MKKWLFPLLVVLAGLLAWFLFARRAAPEPRAVAPESQEAAIQAALRHASPAATTAIEAAFAPASSAREATTQPAAVSAPPAPPTAEAFTNLPPATVMENVQRAFRDYATRFGGNPVGTNPEITRALAGENPRQINFLSDEDGVRANDQGELVDPWGVPFFLHQLAAREMEIRSAGPDRRMWTEDDLVVR